MRRIKRDEVLPERHTEFSPALFDTLFGLLMFLNITSFFSVRGTTQVLFFATCIGVVLHWWLKYKSADDTYGLEVNNSTLDLLFGLFEIIILQAALIAAARGDLVHAVFYLTLPLLTESVWALLWRFFGRWQRNSRKRVRYMEQELEYTTFLNLGVAAALGTLIAIASSVTAAQFAGGFIAIYALYVVLTWRWELIDVKAF